MARDEDILPVFGNLEFIDSAEPSTLAEVAAEMAKDKEIDGILASFRDSESIDSAVPTTTTTLPSTSTEIAAEMAKDSPMDEALPGVPDVDDQARPAISGIRGRWEGVATGSPSVEVDKLGPISTPLIISSTSIVSWAEYQPTSTDEFLMIPNIEQHYPIFISETPRPPSTTLWLQPFLHEAAMEAHRIHQEEIARRRFKGEDSKWSTITHAERFEDKPTDLKEDVIDSDEIVTFIPANSLQEDVPSSSSSNTSAISDKDVSRSNPRSNAIYLHQMNMTSPMVSLEATWPHGPPSEKKWMRGANLTEDELYCTENINTSVLSVGEDHRRPSNTSSAIITDSRSVINSGNRADDHIRQGIITCSSSTTPSYGHDLHGNSSPWPNKRSYSHIMSSSSAIIPEALSSLPLPASSPSGNVRMRHKNLKTARRLSRECSRQGIPQGISSQHAPVMSLSSSSMVSSGEPPGTRPTPENISQSMGGSNAPTQGKRMRWTLDNRHGLINNNPDAVNNMQVCNTSTPIQEAEGMRRRSLRGKGLKSHNQPMLDPSTIQTDDTRRRSIRGKDKVDNKRILDPSTIQSEDMRGMPIRGEGLEVVNRPMFHPSTAQAEISEERIQQHHIPGVDTSVIQFTPQEEAFARQNFPPRNVGQYDHPERSGSLQMGHELEEVLSMPLSEDGLMEMLMRDLMGLGLRRVGEDGLAFNNSEFFGVAPQSEANNLSEEIPTVTRPQPNLSRSDSSQH